MAERHLSWFVSDVHLGLDVLDPAAREARFVAFLRAIPAEETEAVYLLGDIWDFWYEYRDVVPKGYVRVFAALQDLMEAGVSVFFFQGNHDIWTYRYFADMGMVPLSQPHAVTIGGRHFCIGHGDGLGPGMGGYKCMRAIFHNRFLQTLFSTLHPWFAFRLGNGWSKKSRLGKRIGYDFKGTSEPLYRFCADYAAAHPVDFFVFGHYHCAVDMPVVPSGGGEQRPRLLILRDWMEGASWIRFDAADGTVEIGWTTA